MNHRTNIILLVTFCLLACNTLLAQQGPTEKKTPVAGDKTKGNKNPKDKDPESNAEEAGTVEPVESPFKKGDRVVVTQLTRLRLPDKVLGRVRTGIVLEVKETDGRWLWVQSGQKGWLDGRHVVAFDKALEYFTKAIEKDAKDVAAYESRATVLRNQGKLKEAIDDYTQAIKLDPKNAFAYKSRAFAWYQRGEHAKAISDYDQVVKLNREDAFAWNNRGHNHFLLEHYREALRDYKKAIELAPENALALNNHAWLLATCPDSELRDSKAAVASAERACKLTDSKDFDYLDTLAAAYARDGQFDKAVKTVSKAIELAPPEEQKQLKKRQEQYQSEKPLAEKPGK